ncbi:hypothetical protein SRHO_G00246960 [Serrasalmus rhombeus]
MAHAAAHLKKARELEQLSEIRALAKAREKRQRRRERAERKRQVTPTHTYTAAGGGHSDQYLLIPLRRRIPGNRQGRCPIVAGNDGTRLGFSPTHVPRTGRVKNIPEWMGWPV